MLRRAKMKRRISNSSAFDTVTDMFSINRCLIESRSTCIFVSRRNFCSTPWIKFILECKTRTTERCVDHLPTQQVDISSPMRAMKAIFDTNSDLWFCWCSGNSLWSFAHKHLNFDSIPWITFGWWVLIRSDIEMKKKNTWLRVFVWLIIRSPFHMQILINIIAYNCLISEGWYGCETCCLCRQSCGVDWSVLEVFEETRLLAASTEVFWRSRRAQNGTWK